MAVVSSILTISKYIIIFLRGFGAVAARHICIFARFWLYASIRVDWDFYQPILTTLHFYPLPDHFPVVARSGAGARAGGATGWASTLSPALHRGRRRSPPKQQACNGHKGGGFSAPGGGKRASEQAGQHRRRLKRGKLPQRGGNRTPPLSQ